MKALTLLLALLVGCVGQTSYGRCVGAFAAEDPNFVYKTEVNNVVIGGVLFATVIVPVVVVLSMWKCPVEPKPAFISVTKNPR